MDWYRSFVGEDVTDRDFVGRIVSEDLRAYLDQYFSGWRLLQRVFEHRHHPGASPWKQLIFAIQVSSDADAETLRSRLQKIDYKAPLGRRVAKAVPDCVRKHT
jgi:hypothetical protein